jgi:hypothetical protein
MFEVHLQMVRTHIPGPGAAGLWKKVQFWLEVAPQPRETRKMLNVKK